MCTRRCGVNAGRHANNSEPPQRPPGLSLRMRGGEFNLGGWRTKLSSLTDIIALSGAKSFHCHLENVTIFGSMVETYS